MRSSRIAIIPARGGSKGIPRKNIRMFQGKPLICWAIDAAIQTKLFEMVMVSSDDEEICEVAIAHGASVPFLRPKELAEDTSSTLDVVMDLLIKFPEFNFGTLLQPTSPLTTSEDIRESISLMGDMNADSLVSVVKTNNHPQLLYSIKPNMVLRPLSTEVSVSRRQELPEVFALNGAIYNFSIPWLHETRTFVSATTVGFEMPKERSVDIDDEFDWAMATWLHQSRKTEAP